MKNSVKTIDGFDHQCTLAEYIHQTNAHKNFAMGQQSLDLVAYFQRHKKMESLQNILSGIASSWFLRIHETYQNDWSAYAFAFKKHLSSQKTAYYRQVADQT